MRVLRVGKLVRHAPRARLSDHDMAIAVGLRARVPASVTAAASAATALVKGHDMATVVVIALRDHGSAIVAAGASVVADAARVAAKYARSASIM